MSPSPSPSARPEPRRRTPKTSPRGPGAARTPSPAAGQEAPLPAALQLPQAGPPTRRGRKPTTWAAMRQEVDEWHRLAVEQGLPPAPRSPSPPPAPEADPMELGSDGEVAPPVPGPEAPREASELELDEDGFPVTLLDRCRVRD
eukprot:tig00000520_g1814.t1